MNRIPNSPAPLSAAERITLARANNVPGVLVRTFRNGDELREYATEGAPLRIRGPLALHYVG